MIVVNSLSFGLSEKVLSSPSDVKYILRVLTFFSLSFGTLNMFIHCHLACTDFHRKILICVPVYIMYLFHLAAFKIFFLALVFYHFFFFNVPWSCFLHVHFD